MPAAKKIDQVAALKEFLSGASIVIGANYSGLAVGDLEGFRKTARDSGGTYRVVKNRLVRRAAGDIGLSGLGEIIEGPLGLVVTDGEPASVARALTTYVRASRLRVRFTGALLGDRVLSPNELEMLSNLPPREILLAQTLGAMNAAFSGVVSVLHAHLTSIVNVLEARRKQLDEGS
ncbi:MAG: 50S ribosomal protein L10 [Dehalococcoidia bacterium]|jgi:large subunit ribosomal protein L10|nr:50S ribosomal protein L10 [Dehalococcoidia bacterium]